MMANAGQAAAKEELPEQQANHDLKIYRAAGEGCD